MEIFGGFMVMISIIGFFLAVVWLVMPFVVFAIKGKQDRTLEVIEMIEKRLAAIEASLASDVPDQKQDNKSGSSVENRVIAAEAATDTKINDPEELSAAPLHGGL